MSSETTTLAKEVASLVGGSTNVTWVGSCTTRLRFIVKDENKVDLAALNKTAGVLQAIKAGGQIQVVIGTQVEDVRNAVTALPGWGNLTDAAPKEKASKTRPTDAVFEFLGATFQPLIPAITGAALVQVAALLLNQFGVVQDTDPTYLILSAAGNAIFFFLPIFVAFTASKRLGANPFIGATIAAALLHPSFTGIGTAGDVAHAFGLPLFLYSYSSTMFPALLIALALAGLDRVLKRWMPQSLQQVMNPTVEILLLVPLTALVFGPIGAVIGNGIGTGISWLATNAPFVFYVVVPAAWIALVAFGIHWAVISIGLAELASGGSVIFGAGAGYQYAMMGIALGMLIKTARDKNRSLRDTSTAASLSVVIGGITEPTLYGLVLRYRRVLAIEVIAAAASGAVLGLFHTTAIGFSPAPLLALPLMQPTWGAALAMATAVIVAIVLIQIWGYEKPGAASAVTESDAASRPASGGFQGVSDATASTQSETIYSPMAGFIRPLAETGDPVFAGGLIGDGVSIEPTSTRVVAPADGEVVAAPDTGHAVGLRTDTGVELLIHIGIETVQLQGKPFHMLVTQGQRVKRGDPLIEFDAVAITTAGCSLISPVVVTNLAKTQQVAKPATGKVTENTPLFTVVPIDA